MHDEAKAATPSTPQHPSRSLSRCDNTHIDLGNIVGETRDGQGRAGIHLSGGGAAQTLFHELVASQRHGSGRESEAKVFRAPKRRSEPCGTVTLSLYVTTTPIRSSRPAILAQVRYRCTSLIQLRLQAQVAILNITRRN